MGGNYQLTLKKQKILVFNKPACSSQFIVHNTPLVSRYIILSENLKGIFKSTSKVLANQANK